MRLSPPLITLAVGAVLAGGLVAANIVNSARADQAVVAAAAAEPTAPTVPATPEAAATQPAPATPQAPVTPPAPATQAPAAPDAPAVTWTYKGTVAGTDLTAAISVTGDEAVAYVCDGELVEIWLRGTATDGTLDLAGADGETITGTVTRDVVGGVFTSADGEWSLAATSAGWPDWAPPVADGPGGE